MIMVMMVFVMMMVIVHDSDHGDHFDLNWCIVNNKYIIFTVTSKAKTSNLLK